MFLEECNEHFNTKCLYQLLGVSKDCVNSELKKGYYRLSMKWHPDKSNIDEPTKKLHTVRFQLLNKAYSILSDSEKRKLYDETGSVDDDAVELSEDAVNAWRKLFKKVTKEDIDNYMNEYKGSEEQENELIEIFNKFDGNIEVVLHHAIGFDDYDSLKQKIEQLIADGKLKKTAKYKASTTEKKEKARRKKQEKEAKEAERILNEIAPQGGDTSLEAMILARNSKRAADMNSFFDGLAEKYAPKKKANKKK